MSLSTQNRVRVTVQHPLMPVIDWDKATGGDRTNNTTKVRPAAGKAKVVLAGESEVDNVTTEAYIDPVAHATLLARLASGETFTGATVSRQFIDAAEVPVGAKIEHLNCSVAKFTPPDADANGEDGAKLVIEWMVSD